MSRKNLNTQIENVLFITSIDFKKRTSAAANRILCYCKALCENGISVYIASDINGYIFRYDGNSEDKLVEIFSVHKYPGRKSIFSKVIGYEFFFKHNNTYLTDILKFVRTIGYRFSLFYYPASFSLTIMLLIFKVRERLWISIEKNELGFARKKNYPKPSSLPFILWVPILWSNVLISSIEDLAATFFDSIITISTRMEDLYKRFGKSLVFRVPILISINYGVDDNYILDKDVFTLCYSGTIADTKDSIIELCLAVNDLFHNKKINIKLDMYGPMPKSTSFRLQRQGLLMDNPAINYKGIVDVETLNKNLRKYDLLVMLRRDTMQNRFGFATKLGNYLCTGLPVLTTNVGDNAIYLKDAVSAYLLDYAALNKESISKKIVDIMDDPHRASIGKNGKKVAAQNFLYSLHSQTLIQALTPTH